MQNKTVDQTGLISAAQTLSRITSENKPHTHCSEGEERQTALPNTSASTQSKRFQ